MNVLWVVITVLIQSNNLEQYESIKCSYQPQILQPHNVCCC